MSFLVAYCSSSSYHFLSFVSFTPQFLLLSLQLSLLLFSPLVSLLFSLSFSFLHFSIHIFLLPSPSLPISLLISPFLVSSFPPVLRDDNPWEHGYFYCCRGFSSWDDRCWHNSRRRSRDGFHRHFISMPRYLLSHPSLC